MRHTLEDPAEEQPRRSSWHRRLYLLELVILVVGILTAFSLESWWVRRAEDRRRVANLLALREDFVQNRARLDSVTLMLGQVQGAGTELLRIMQTGAAPSADSLGALAAALFRLVGFEAVTSAYDNLVNANDLRLVRDTELRLALATFAGQSARVAEVERWQNDQWVFVNQMFVNEQMEVSDLVPYWVDKKTHMALPAPAFRTDWPRVLGNRQFRNIVMQRVVAADDVLRTQRILHEQTAQIIRLIDRTLRRGG